MTQQLYSFMELYFREKKKTQLNYFFEKCRVWQLRVTDGTKLVHINQNQKSKNSVFFSE